MCWPTDWDCNTIIAYSTFGLFVATSFLMVFTFKLWSATKTLVEGSKDTAERQLRAYVAQINISLESGGVKIEIKNNGQTPAYDLEVWSAGGHNEPSPEYGYSYMNRMGGPVLEKVTLAAGEPRTFSAPTGIETNSATNFYVHACIIYRDIFGRWWRFKLCHIHDRNTRFRLHGDYNGEDGPHKVRPSIA